MLITHPLGSILRTRMLAIACGYEDADDLDHLRKDPAFRLACGRLPDTGNDLCSQPTMSRWENAPTLREILKLSGVLIDCYCASYATPPQARGARKLRYDLQTCFNNIFIEAEFRGNFSPNDVWRAFETSADKSKFQTMIEEWDHTYAKIWRGIGFEDLTEKFSEVSEEPFSDQEIALLEAGMRELEKMNSDFLDMAVSRAEVLVQRELGITNSRSALQAVDIRSHSTKRRRGRSAKFAA